jgi:hypothetical protein
VAKRKPIPTPEDVDKAMNRAAQGKGHQLALAIHAMPLADLTKVLDRMMPLYGTNVHDTWLLHTLITCVHARRQGKADWNRQVNKRMKEIRARPAALNPA